MIKGIYKNSQLTSINGERLKVSSLRPGIKQGYLLLLLLFNFVLEILTTIIRWEDEKRHVDGKEVKSIHRWRSLICKKKKILKNSSKLLAPMNKFSKFPRCRINTHNSVVFLYTSNEQHTKKIRNIIPFTVAFKRTKYLGINLTKEVKDLYTENYKVLLKKIK